MNINSISRGRQDLQDIRSNTACGSRRARQTADGCADKQKGFAPGPLLDRRDAFMAQKGEGSGYPSKTLLQEFVHFL
jgi:hypothetical protein